MDLNFTDDELAFARRSAPGWPRTPKEISHKVHNACKTKSDLQTWARILGRKGLAALPGPGSSAARAGTRRSATCSKECAARRAPRIVPFGPVMVAPVIMAFGTPEQQQRFLPGIMSGEVWWSQGYSEPDRAGPGDR